MDLVSKRDYPLYYTMIKSPISMNMIKKRIHSTYYRTIAQFRDEFHLMFNNARIFNEEDSFVYEDADEMQVIYFCYFQCEKKKKKLSLTFEIKKIFNAKLEEVCPGGIMQVDHSYLNTRPRIQDDDDEDEYDD